MKWLFDSCVRCWHKHYAFKLFMLKTALDKKDKCQPSLENKQDNGDNELNGCRQMRRKEEMEILDLWIFAIII